MKHLFTAREKSKRITRPKLATLRFLYGAREPDANFSDSRRKSFANDFVSNSKPLMDCKTRFDSMCIVLHRNLNLVHFISHNAENIKHVTELNF